jgi:hypothetical protein
MIPGATSRGKGPPPAKMPSLSPGGRIEGAFEGKLIVWSARVGGRGGGGLVVGCSGENAVRVWT